MFYALLRFELSYQLTRRVSWLFSIIFFLLGFLFGGQSYVPNNISYNSPYELSSKIGLLSLGAVFAIMFFCVNGILRDRQCYFESILFSTKMNKFQFFWTRFLGVFMVSLIVFTLTMLGFVTGVNNSSLDPSRILPFNIIHYLWVWLVFALPNIFICVAIIFSVNILSKNTIATYAAAIFIYAFYWLCSIFLNSPLLASSASPSETEAFVASLLDPFGLSAFFKETQFWTPIQKNIQQVAFKGLLIWNRAIWILFSSVVLSITYRNFSFRKSDKKYKKKYSDKEEKNYPKIRYKKIKALHFDVRSDIKHLYSLVRIELNNVFKSLPFIAIVVIWIVIISTEVLTRVNNGGNYNESIYPTTNFIIWLIKDPLPVLGLLLVVFYSGEIVWRSRVLNFYKILDAVPTKNMIFFMSQLITLIILPMLLIIISILLGIGIQIFKGYYHFEVGQYLSLLYYSGTTFIFYATFSLFIHSIVDNKYLGMFITGVFMLLFNSSLMQSIGVHHPLFYLGNHPEVYYTNMTGYGDYATPFHHYALHWGILAVILGLITFKIWRRGGIQLLGSRFRVFSYKKDKWYSIVLTVLCNVFFISAFYIYYNTSVLTEYVTSTDDLDQREAYERKYKLYESLRKLVPIDIKTEVDIYPEEGKYLVKGNYILKNKSEEAVVELLISDNIPIRKIELEYALLVKHDSVLNTRLYRFERPILPNEELKFYYEVFYQKKGFSTSNILVNNGTFILHNFFEPFLGYRSNFEIQNQFERTKRGLPKRVNKNANSSHLQSQYEKVPFETVVSTQGDQIAVAPGDLVRTWKEANRNYYHYKIQNKVIPMLGYFSGVYTVEKETYKGVDIEHYYHPEHHFNITDITSSIKQTLDYCQKEFGKYKFDHIRLLEIPSHWSFGGMAQPGVIAMVEDNLYLIDTRNREKFNVVAKRTIHEVTHQWIGHSLTPKNVSGGGVITEGLTKYVEIVLMDKLYGKKAVWQLCQTSNRQYFKGRSFEANEEPSLETEKGQAYILYGKSSNIMLALKELISEDKMNLVIRSLFNKYEKDIEPRLTIKDFLDELFLVTPKKYHVLISDWFKKRIIYDLKIDKASYRKLKNGKYEVMINIKAKRFDTKDTGELFEIPINEPIHIGAFSTHPSSLEADEGMIYSKLHQINKDSNRILLQLDNKPNYIAIDPFGARLEEDKNDNMIIVK